MLAEDSSSASANRSIFIRATEWASAGILKVFPAEGPSFFARLDDLCDELAAALLPGSARDLLLDGDQADAIEFARLCYVAERDAMAFLARSEHTRVRLSMKLVKKGHPEPALRHALDRLEAAGYLSETRFAELWLRGRASRCAEGRVKLLAGLLSRGVPRDIAEEALSAYFADSDERSLCAQAMEKLMRTGKTGDKLVFSLMRKGFSPSLIKSCMKTVKDYVNNS